MKRTLGILLILIMIFSLSSCASEDGPKGEVMLYASMQEEQLQEIEKAFEARYPDVEMEYYFAGGGEIVEKMNKEAAGGGQIAGDLVWLGDPLDFETFKANGWLTPYVSSETEHISKKYVDSDGYYTAARLVSMGISCSKDADKAPKTWNDLLDPGWKDKVIMTDPAKASTTKYWVAAMMQSDKYGPAYFRKLRDNGVELETGTRQTHERVADAADKAGICLDYLSENLIAEGKPIVFNYTSEDVITMTSPIAMIKGCANEDNAKLLMDFILSKEGQEILVDSNLVTVRDDIEMQTDLSAITEANLPVDYNELSRNLQKYMDRFNKIFNR